jgi:hypothetical protein
LRVDGVDRDVIQAPNRSLESCALRTHYEWIATKPMLPTSRVVFGVWVACSTASFGCCGQVHCGDD